MEMILTIAAWTVLSFLFLLNLRGSLIADNIKERVLGFVATILFALSVIQLTMR